MSTAAPLVSSAPLRTRRPALRPLVLPNEHGGWGLLFEPIVLALVVRPSWDGVFVGLTFVFAFLARQPLRFALQDVMHERSVPRTRYCWTFAGLYALAAATSLGFALAGGAWTILIPLGLVAPFGVTQLLYDAHNRSRQLFPELVGAAAMTSSAAAIALAGGMRILPAFALAGVILARTIPTIVYVRTLLQRAHGRDVSSSWPLALHAMAILLVALFASKIAVAAMCILFIRATWMLAMAAPPPAKRIGWTEIAFGALSVLLFAL
jgi:hypothetical protein